MRCNRFEQLVVIDMLPVPTGDGALRDGEAGVFDDEIWVENLLVPNPSQLVQAPLGLLKEKSRGSSLGMEYPQLAQA